MLYTLKHEAADPQCGDENGYCDCRPMGNKAGAWMWWDAMDCPKERTSPVYGAPA